MSGLGWLGLCEAVVVDGWVVVHGRAAAACAVRPLATAGG